MGTTSKDLDYPESTGYVRDGASAIRALAEDTDDALGGAIFRATVATETIANGGDDDRLELTLTVDDSPLFSNDDGNLITYTGPKATATLYGRVSWEADNTGERRIRFIVDGDENGRDRVPADAGPITQNLAWPVVLHPGDKVGLTAWQNSGGPLDVTSAALRCVIHGIAP